MSDLESTTPPVPNSATRRAWVVTVIFAIVLLVPSMIGFVMKFIELIKVVRGEAEGEFAVTPVVNYLFASLGFLCMLAWATRNGMFRDLEHPKFTMLETERELDRHA